MCRITGFISPTFNQSDLTRMRDSMHRGGPDDAGIYHDPAQHVFLGHRRLALIDLTPAGHQPMTDPFTPNQIQKSSYNPTSSGAPIVLIVSMVCLLWLCMISWKIN